jgi:regulator of protease activity HflC (stomatin/prohibitin superfamily)
MEEIKMMSLGLSIVLGSIGGVAFLTVLSGIKIVRPVERGVVETFGKFTKIINPGLNFVIPGIQKFIGVNITEKMSNIEPQEIITKDNLNACVDLVVYYKIRADDQSIQKSVYSVNNLQLQLDTLARTTARNVIGTMDFREVNSERAKLNDRLFKILSVETKAWGVDVLKVELKEITPPKNVQETMNKVIQAENEKEAAINHANAVEIDADGFKRAEIKKAEGTAIARVTIAKSKAEAIKLVNESAEKYFKGNAQALKQLEVAEETLKNNSKVILGNSVKDILKLFDVNK